MIINGTAGTSSMLRVPLQNQQLKATIKGDPEQIIDSKLQPL